MTKCKICGDPIKRCPRGGTNNWCHTWRHEHVPKPVNKINYYNIIAIFLIITIFVYALFIYLPNIQNNTDNFFIPTKNSNEISETISDISDKLLGDCGNRNILTTEQCDYWVENNINNKYVKWNGIMNNIKDGNIYVDVKFKSPSYRIGGENIYIDKSATIVLHGISKNELLNINKNKNIQFTGKLYIKKNYYAIPGYYNSWLMMTSGVTGQVDLYDSKIISNNIESPTKSNIKSGISPVTTLIPISPLK